MHHIKSVFGILTVVLCLLLSSASCSTEDRFNTADRYFEGLDALQSGNKVAAISAFTKSRKQDSPTASALATKELLPLLYEIKGYSAILDITNIPALINDADLLNKKTDDSKSQDFYEIDPNVVYRYRLLAMFQINHPQTLAYIADWVVSQVFSTEHALFFGSDEFATFSAQTLNPENDFFAKTLDLIEFRVALYKRDYAASLKVGQAQETETNHDDMGTVPNTIFENHTALLLSDIGKALLYGTTNRVYYAELLGDAAKTYPDKSDEAFMCHFYAARLYDNAGPTYRSIALEQFEAAMGAAKTPERYDNALWYYLTTVNKISSRSAISALQEFAPQWNDPYYFDDFLSTIAFSLLSAENWKGFYALYEVLHPYMADASLSKYAYISGRLIEEGFLHSEFSVDAGYKNERTALRAAKKTQKEAFETAFNTINGNLYYKIMAAEKLELSSAQTFAALLQREKKINPAYDEGLEYILTEYIDRGYAQYVYPLYIKNSSSISFEVAIELSTNLVAVNNPSAENNFENNFYPESLRIASRELNQAGKDISKKEMQLLYPRFYDDYVENMAELYGLSESVLYALIRSESFFDHDVQSWAGAVGLTQLIPSTAGDVARKLKVEDYNLHDAEINIAFGAFYLDELIPRIDNSMLRALFSYNAGISNVRRWVIADTEISAIPDLFLEIIPFAETREYGRKILSAAAMYGMLYYDKIPSEIVAEIMQ